MERSARAAQYARLIRLARDDVGMSQAELATAAGIQQPTISAYENGSKRPRPETLQTILRAARLRPSVALAVFAEDVREAALRHRLHDVRVFGSALRGTDSESSDIDLLVAVSPGASLFDLGGFSSEVETLTGFSTDVLTDSQVDNAYFAHVSQEAVLL